MPRPELRPGAPQTLLVADDDPQVVAALARCLREAGFEVLEAVDGKTAIDHCASRPPDLAIIDYEMTGLDGERLARQLSARPPLSVIFMSAHRGVQMVQDAVAAGALAYLVKPVDTHQMLAAVRTALERGRELNELRQQTNHLDTALQKRRTVSVAVGLVMGRLQVDQQRAFELLRRHARSTRRRLQDVAAELLSATEEASRLLASMSRNLDVPVQSPAPTGARAQAIED